MELCYDIENFGTSKTIILRKALAVWKNHSSYESFNNLSYEENYVDESYSSGSYGGALNIDWRIRITVAMAERKTVLEDFGGKGYSSEIVK